MSDVTEDAKTYTVRLRERGQLTIPQPVRESLGTRTVSLTMVQIGDVLILTPREPQLPRLADEFADILDKEGVSLADLLIALEEERQAIWSERQSNGA